MMTKRLAIIFLTVFALSCGDDINLLSDSPTAPSQTKNKVEFRVFGSNLSTTQVTIRHTNSIDGMTNFTGLVPYLSSFDSTDDSVFLYLEATANPFSSFPAPNLQVQIFVDGRLFREGAAQGTFPLYAQAAGTFRR